MLLIKKVWTKRRDESLRLQVNAITVEVVVQHNGDKWSKLINNCIVSYFCHGNFTYYAAVSSTRSTWENRTDQKGENCWHTPYNEIFCCTVLNLWRPVNYFRVDLHLKDSRNVCIHMPLRIITALYLPFVYRSAKYQGGTLEDRLE